MPRHWYIKTKSGKKGPVTSKRLIRLAAKGQIQPNSGVSSDGESWIKAKQVSGLNFHLPEAEPPTRWYVKTKGGDAGPFTLPKLNKLIAKGRIRPDFAVSTDGDQWMQACQIPGIEFPQPIETALNETEPTDPVPVAVDPVEPVTPATEAIEDAPPIDADNVDAPDVEEPDVEEPDVEAYKVEASEVDDHNVDEPEVDESEVESTNVDTAQLEEPECEAAEREEPIQADVPTEVSQEDTTDISDALARQDTIVDDRLSGEELFADQDDSFEDQPLLVSQSLPHTCSDLKAQWAELREAEYARRFGPVGEVSRATDPGGLVDVHVHPPDGRRPMTTLVTSGMSDVAMDVPHGACSPRAELLMYVQHMHPDYVTLLRALAELPHHQKTRLSYGSLLDNGKPARPIFQGSVLDSYVFMIPNVESDFRIQDSLRIDDDPLQLLWVVPITSAERDVISGQGMQAFCGLLDRNAHPLVLDPLRRCYANSAAAMSFIS